MVLADNLRPATRSLDIEPESMQPEGLRRAGREEMLVAGNGASRPRWSDAMPKQLWSCLISLRERPEFNCIWAFPLCPETWPPGAPVPTRTELALPGLVKPSGRTTSEVYAFQEQAPSNAANQDCNESG